MHDKRWTLVAVVLGSAIVFFDSTMVPVALPRMGEELPSTAFGTLEAQSYVYYGYLLSLSALLVLAGALGDHVGRKRAFVWGLAGFGATSLLCGVAPNMEVLIAGRVLQGVAGAFLVPASLAIVTATFEEGERGRAFGVWAGASALSSIVAPVIGGLLVSEVSWRAAFLLNLPLIAFALCVTIRFVGESRDEESTGGFDWIGAVTIAVAVGGLSFGAIRGEAEQWRATTAYVSLALGAVAAFAFPVLMARSPHPLVPLELFRSRNFSVTNASTLLIYASIYVVFQYLALYTIGVLGYDEMGYGLAVVPASVFLALFAVRIGRLADRYGPRWFMAGGPAIMGAGILWLARIPADSGAWRDRVMPPSGYLVDVLPALVVFGLGLMVVVAPLTAALMRSVPVAHAGVASAFNNAISRVGPQLAGAGLFVVISSTFYAGLDDRLPDQPIDRQQVAPLNRPADATPALRRAATEASTEAFRQMALIGAGLCFAGAAVNALGIRNPAPPPEPRRCVTRCPQSPPLEVAVPST